MAARKKKTPSGSAEIALPSVRTYRLWTPAQLRQAEANADGGNIRLAVDICDWLLGDGKVRGALDGRINALFGLTPTFERSGDGRRSSRAVKAIEGGEDWLTCFPKAASKQVQYWAILLGLGPAVLRWKRLKEHDDRDLPILDFYHPQPLAYDWAKRTWLRSLDNGTREPITFGDGVWFGHMPFGEYRPWSLGLWRALAPWVLLKQFARSDWGILGESARKEFLECPKDLDSPAPQRKELANDIYEMAQGGVGVLPPGYTYKLVETSAGTKDLYEAQIRLADTAIAMTIRAGNLTTQVDGATGSRAAAEVHERGDLGNLKDDADAWTDTTHDHSTVYWADSNFGDPGLAPWAIYPTEPEEDRKVKADVALQALAGVEKAESLGFETDRKAFIEEYRLDYLKPGEVVDPDEHDGGDPPDDQDQDNEDDTEDPPAGRGAAVALTKAQRNGQGYADRVRKRMVDHGTRALAPTIAGIVAAVSKAKSYDEAKRLILEKYGKLAAPKTLATLTEAALTMSELGGELSVRQDVPELEQSDED